jgi:hypothetical protein
MLQKEGASALVNLQVLTSTNLLQDFTNAATNVTFPVDLPGDRHFLRIRVLGQQ